MTATFPPAGPYRASREQRTANAVAGAAPLLNLLAVLAAAATPDVVCRTLTGGALLGRSLIGVSVCLLNQDAQALVLAGAHGWSEEENDRFQLLPLTVETGPTQALRDRVDVTCRFADLRARYPIASNFANTLEKQLGPLSKSDGELISVVIEHGAEPVGVLVVGLAEPLERTWEIAATWTAVKHALAPWCALLAAEGNRERPRQSPGGNPRPPMELTPRQAEILLLVEQGHSLPDIAERVSYSPSTIKHDLTAAGALLGTTSREDTARSARQAGLLPSSDQLVT